MDNNMERYLGQMLDGRYEILEVIGKGGMAYVFKARCHLLNRFVAIKMLREDMAADATFRDNFKKEAQAVAMLSHPNIVAIYDVSRVPDMDYIVMELIEGITLKMYMKTKGALSLKESIHFTTQIAKALSHAHAKGIVHRDIKPQNIMIGMDGSVKVADFGIAHLENAKVDNTAVGSVHYISPEQAKGQAVDARSDIYSLGVAMYEMLTGCLPYTGDSAESVALQHVSAVPKSLREINPEIPAELEAITLKAMNADLTQRYQTVDELLEDLNEYRLSSTGPVPVVQTAPTPAPVQEVVTELPPNVAPLSRSGELSKESYARRRRRANRVSMLSGIVLVLAFIVAVFIFLWNYWLSGLFAEPVRINIPNFVGSTYEKIINNADFKSIYNFDVVYEVDADADAGVIISQEPAAGKSIMQDDDGIDVTLTVSTGTQMIPVPDVANMEYREAVLALQKEGFVPEVSYENSDITEDYVIYTSPEAGDSLPAGSIVYVIVSSGPDIVTMPMPNLVGLTRAGAEAKLESCNLVVGSITYVDSDEPAGTVIWQSIDAYTTVKEHDKVYLQISNGPKEPEEEETTEPEDSTETDVQPEAPSNGG